MTSHPDNTEILIHHEDISALSQVVEGFSDETKVQLEHVSAAVLSAVNGEGYEIKFTNLIRLIDFVFDTTPSHFINNGVTNEAGQNLGSLKVLTFALLLGLTTDQALKLFGEHWKSVQENPDGNDHQNIRALDEYGIEGVKIHGVPFSEKS